MLAVVWKVCIWSSTYVCSHSGWRNVCELWQWPQVLFNETSNGCDSSLRFMHAIFTKILGSMLLCCKKCRYDPIGHEISQHWSTLHRGPVWFWEQCGQHLLPDPADCEGAEASIALSTPFLKQMSYCSIDLSLKCQSCFINFFCCRQGIKNLQCISGWKQAFADAHASLEKELFEGSLDGTKAGENFTLLQKILPRSEEVHPGGRAATLHFPCCGNTQIGHD